MPAWGGLGAKEGMSLVQNCGPLPLSTATPLGTEWAHHQFAEHLQGLQYLEGGVPVGVSRKEELLWSRGFPPCRRAD